MDSLAASDNRWSNRRICGVLLALGLLPVLPVLTAPLLMGYDDRWVTTDNPLITGGLSSFWNQLILPFTPEGKSSGHWSPLVFLSFAIEHKISGTAPSPGMPWGAGNFTPVVHRLINGLYHGACGALVFSLAQRLLQDRFKAILSALIFLFHPLCCESVCWVVERNNLMPAFFGFLALYVFTGARGDGRTAPGWPRVLAASGILLLAQLCKVSGVVWWPVLVAWDVLVFERGGRPTLHALGLSAARALLLLPPIALSLYTSVVTHDFVLLPQIADPSLGAIGPWLSSVYLFLRYLLMQLIPVELSAFYHVPVGVPPWSDPRFFGGLAALAGLTFAARRAGLSWKILILAWVWMLASVAPPINPIKTTAYILQDRYTYPGMAAFAMLISTILVFAISRVSATAAEPAKEPRLLKPMCGLLTGVLLVLTLWRATYWRDLETLYADATIKQPRAAMGHAYYADYLFQSGGLDDPQKAKEIITHFELALACDDFEHLQWPLHYKNEYANILLQLKNPAAAVKAKALFEDVWKGRAERSTERGAKVMAARYLVYDHFQSGRMKEGFALLDEALRSHPENIELRLNKVVALEQTRQFEQARKEATAVLANPKIDPQFRQALQAALERMKGK